MRGRTCLIILLFIVLAVLLGGCQRGQPSVAKTEIPLLIFQQVPEGQAAFRGVWNPEAGTLEVDANPSFALKGAEGTDISPLYWDGGPQIYLFAEHEGKAAVINHGPTLQASVVRHTGLPPEAVAPVFYASGDRRYVAYGLRNNLGIVETGPNGTKKWLFSAQEASPNKSQNPNSKAGVFTDPKTGLLVDIVTPDPKGPQPPDPDSLPEKGMKNLPSLGNGELVPLFLAEREGRLVVLAVLNRPTASEELFLVRIDAVGQAAWVPVARKGDPQCSFIAGAGVKAGLYGSRLYLESPCGEEIQSLSLDEEKPRLVSEEGLTRELKAVMADNAPTEGQVRPSFGAYQGLLLVSTLTGGAQGRGDETEWLLAFKEGRLLGKMALRLGTGEATVYANGATKHHQLPSPVARLLYPAGW
jgi:hypothetical protein